MLPRDAGRRGSPAARIILIGGAPMSGKTSGAVAMARALDRVVISTDDLGAAARAVTSPDIHGDLHALAGPDLVARYARCAPDELVEQARRAHRDLWPAIEAVARAHASWARPAVIEGWAVLPAAVRRLGLDSLAAIWIGVPDPVIEARVRADATFLSGSPHTARAIEHFIARSVAFGRWLRQEAVGAGLPFLDLAGDETPELVARRCLDALPSG